MSPPGVRARLGHLLGAPAMTQRPRRRSPAAWAAAAERLVEPLEPQWRARGDAVPWSLASVYRRSYVESLRTHVDAGPQRATLWALDAEAPALRHLTIGTGPGLRFTLLNRCYAAAMAAGHDPGRDWFVVADDDCVFRRGDVPRFLRFAAGAGLDLAAPSHHRWSHLSWPVERHRLLSLVRLCRYVEQGPLVAFGPAAQASLLPLPEDIGMGWGIEASWAAHAELQLGIIDAVLVDHLKPVSPAGGYDTAAQWRQASRLMAEAGFEGWPQVQAVLGCWRPWQRAPRWSSASPRRDP